ncbi:uncharacterized protein [Montipora foliosa]|uniref:uncharacterized protein isoform X1 n=1 Tax=Montipora foliosa TaxID=591990 RepID=UPI0035F13EB4
MDRRSSSQMPVDQASNMQSCTGNVSPPVKCTLCHIVSGNSTCPRAGKHHELIMALAKSPDTTEVEKTDFKKSLDKFTKTKWIHTDCVPEKNKEICFPLVHWVCILGKYKLLGYLISECGFILTVKGGQNSQSALHSMVQYLARGLGPSNSTEYIGSIFGNILDIFLKHVPEVLCAKDSSLGDTILHYLAKRCSSDPYSRMYLKICLLRIKENNKLKYDEVEKIFSVINKSGNSFLHHLVSDEESVDSLEYFSKNFHLISEKISKNKNNSGKTPRQLAVEKRSCKMLRALGAPAVVIASLQKAVAGSKALTPKSSNRVEQNNSQSIAAVEAKDSNSTREVMPVETNSIETPTTPPNLGDGNVLCQSDTVKGLSKGEGATQKKAIGKRPAPRVTKSSGPSTKRSRVALEWSDSESDVDDDDFKLDDDSDDFESEEEDDVDGDKDIKGDNNGAAGDASRNVMLKDTPSKRADENIIFEAAPKHTPFCHTTCTAQHHKLILSLLKCSNYNYGAANGDNFMKQVNEIVTQAGKFARLRVNADLVDPVASFKYPLVHWVCVLGKFRVLGKLAEMKEFNLAVQSERTGETGVHRMLLSLGQVLKKNSVKTILEVFSKTLRTLTDCVPKVVTLSNKEGDTPFHCLAKIVLDCTGELEKISTYEGYFAVLMKELAHLKTSGKLTPNTVKELLLKTNHSKETFLHILACRHGAGHRVIKIVMKNIEPEIMDALKEIKNTNGKTPSDLSKELHSYEMAAILQPHDFEVPPLPNDHVAKVQQTPDKSIPLESPLAASPPATLFVPVDNCLSPLVSGGSTGHTQLFVAKEEPEDAVVKGHKKEDLFVEDEVPSTSKSSETSPLPSLKLLPDEAFSTPPISEDTDATVLLGCDSEVTEDISVDVMPDARNDICSPSIATDHIDGSFPPVVAVNQSSSTSVPTSSINSDTSSLDVSNDYDRVSNDYDRVSNAPSVTSNQNTPPISRVVLGNDDRSTNVSLTTSQNGDANVRTSEAWIKRNGEPSGIKGQNDKLLTTLHAKFQEELILSERGLKEKEDALLLIHHQIAERQEKKQRLMQELEENWIQLMTDKKQEGILEAEIAVRKNDCKRFKAELVKYASTLKTIRK